MSPFPRDYEIDAAMKQEEAPEPERSSPVAVRGTRLPCPHCGTVSYFGIGETPGLIREQDFSLYGTTFCCGNTVRVRCGRSTEVTKDPA